MDEEIPVTVVMRSYNDAALLPRTLAALDGQRGVRVDLAVFESASDDDSLRILAEHGYRRIHHLAPGSYHSSMVLNRGVAEAETELVAFLNSDAVMIGDDVLLRLARAVLADERCAGAYARQVPRADARIMTRLDHHIAFDRRHELDSGDAAMSLVCSLIRRGAWFEQPFHPALTFAEDCVWARQMQGRGWDVRYVPEAVVEHSHDYDREQRYRRSFGDAAALAVLLDRPPPEFVRGCLLSFAGRCLRDCVRLARLGQLRHCWRLPAHRWPMVHGRWCGLRAGWRRFHGGEVSRTVRPPAPTPGLLKNPSAEG